MPRLSDKLPINNELLDRRVKLTHAQKKEIQQKYFFNRIMTLEQGLHPSISQRSLAKEYGVSRRTIQFAIYPERRIENVKARNARGGSKLYYNKEKWKYTMRDHRQYKKELHMQGLI